MSDLTSTLSAAENAACGCGPDEDWCALCKRATCHLGEHDEAQLLEFYGQAPRGANVSQVQ